MHHDPLEPVLQGIGEFLDHLSAGSPAAQKRILAFMAAQAAAEERVRQDYTGRYPMELLQNAHDAGAEADHVGGVDFWLTPTALLVANEGVPFDEEHIESLVNLGLSEKTTKGGRRKTIGYKGIGFSSVFEICERPQILTPTMAFSFDQARARTAVADALGREVELVPVRAFPFRICERDWAEDGEVVQRLFSDGAVTVVRLPLRDQSYYERVEESLSTSLPPEALLFSPFLRSLSVTVGDATTTWRRTSSRKHSGGGRIVFLESQRGERRGWLISHGTASVTAALVAELNDRLWADVRELSYAVALPWRGAIVSNRRPQRLHVYYPTDDVLDRAILVHGDFYVTSDRRRVEANNAGGKISGVVAEAASKELAKLAESVAASQGAQLLQALAPAGDADGFGHQLGEAIDAALRKAQIARGSTGTVRVPEAFVIFDGRQLSETSRSTFAHMFGRQADLLRVLDGDASTIPFLEHLGAEVLDDAAAVERIRHTPTANYASRIRALVDWLDMLERKQPYQLQRALSALRRKPILVDVTGAALRPDKAVLRIADVPPLPAKLQKREVKLVHKADSTRLFQRLDVDELDLAAAVKLVLDAVASRFGTDPDDGQAVLAFLLAVWRRDPRLIEGNSRVGSVRVPAKTASGSSVEWIAAEDTYFSSSWTGNDNLERVYGPFKEHEFLGADPPKRGKGKLHDFFAALGVLALPALQPHRLEWPGYWPLGSVRGRAWQRAVDPGDTGACPDHPRSQIAQVEVADRLVDLLDEDLSVRRATALAALLSATRVPFGADAVLKCTNTTHRRAPSRKVMGFEEWLLRTVEWVPTRDPDSDTTTLRRFPNDAPHGVGESRRRCDRREVRARSARDLSSVGALRDRGQRPSFRRGEHHLAEPDAELADRGEANIDQAGGCIRYAALEVRTLEHAADQDVDRRERVTLAKRADLLEECLLDRCREA